MNIKNIAENRKARHDYYLEDTYEAGIVLSGSEIKSIREGKVNLKDSYVQIRNEEAYIINMHISPYEKKDVFEYEATRRRKLLLHKREIRKIKVKLDEKGYALIPTKIYLKDSYAKLEIALAKGKKNYDKREVSKNKTMEMNIKRSIKEYNK